MSHRVVSGFFLAAIAAALLVFNMRPPRAQTELAMLDRLVRRTIDAQPPGARLYFRTDSAAAESFVWCRYFTAPRMLLAGPGKGGDTVLWLHHSLARRDVLEGLALRTFTEGPLAASIVALP